MKLTTDRAVRKASASQLMAAWREAVAALREAEVIEPLCGGSVESYIAGRCAGARSLVLRACFATAWGG